MSHSNKIHLRGEPVEKKGGSLESKFLLEQIFNLEETIKRYKMVIV